MKVVTLRQPWAWAVANGHMPILNRNDDVREYPYHRYLAIHASDKAVNEEDREFLAMRIGQDRLPKFFAKGGIVGVVTIQRSVYDTERLPLWYKQWRDDAFRYAWIVKRPHEIELVDCKGEPGELWDPPPAVRSVVLSLYRDVLSRDIMDKLITKRKESGITQEYLAGLLGYTNRQIINIENRGTGGVRKLLMFLDVVGFNIEDPEGI